MLSDILFFPFCYKQVTKKAFYAVVLFYFTTENLPKLCHRQIKRLIICIYNILQISASPSFV